MSRPWNSHEPSPQEREAKPLEDVPRLQRHNSGAHHPGQRAKAKRRARKRNR